MILVFAISGCATLGYKPQPWTREEKVMLVCSVCAAGADYYTTIRCLDHGGRELNPFIGEYPTDTELTIRGWGFYGLFLLVAHYIPGLRKPLLMGQTTMNAGASIVNYRLVKDLRDQE